MSKKHFEDGLKQQKNFDHYILISVQGIMQNFISHIYEKINYSMSLFYFLACLHVLHAYFPQISYILTSLCTWYPRLFYLL